MAIKQDDEGVTQEIALLDEMSNEIAALEEVGDAKEKRDQVDVLARYAKAAGRSLEMQNKCTQIRLRLERKIGELLIKLEIRAGNPQFSPRVNIGATQSLSALGISRNQSAKWQKLAKIPDLEFEEYVRPSATSAIKASEVTTAGALKLFRKEEKRAAKVAVMQRVVVAPYIGGSLIQGDMVDILGKKNGQFSDLIVTDPPFGLGETADIAFSDRENMSKPAGAWDGVDVADQFGVWARMFRRAIKPTGSLYCFVSDRYIAKMFNSLEGEGFIIRELLVWRKTNPPPSVRMSNHRSDVEYIIYATAGDEYILNWLGQERMLKSQSLPICGGKERLDHPAQKPVALLKQYIEASSNVGDLVLDPFAGVGSTGAAAEELGRRYLLIERDDYNFRQTCIRLQGTV